MVYFYLSVVVGVVIAIAMSYVRRKHSYWAERDVLAYPPLYPYGYLRQLGKHRSLHEILRDFYDRAKPSGAKFIGSYFYTEPVVLAIDLNLIKHILVKDFQHFHGRGVYDNTCQDPLMHLFALDGQQWKMCRQDLSTCTTGKMKLLCPVIIKIITEFCATVEDSLKNGPEVELRVILTRFTTDVIGLDGNLTTQKNPHNAELRINALKLFEKIDLAKHWLISIFVGKNVVSENVSDFYNKVRSEVSSNLSIEIANSQVEASRWTESEIVAQALMIFISGFETTSTVVSFALYELAQNREVQYRARECVQETLRQSHGMLNYDTLMKMTYITQCVKESLRNYPPVADLVRVVTEDYPVPESDVVFFKGQRVFIPVYAIHHDPEIYENPEVYDPNRFTPENEAARNPYAFLPFGEGPRNCIGLRFGMMQARIGLAVLLSHFRFELSPKTKVPLEMSKNSPILAPVDGGIWLKVEKI